MSAKQHDDYYNAPISTGDAAAMLRRQPQQNERPYTSTTTKLNNRQVDEWKKNVLDKTANRGSIPSGRVWNSWQLYNEGNGVKKYIELRDKGMIPQISLGVLEFWKDFFKKSSVEEMHQYGSGVISFGWSIIQNEIKIWYANEKWDNLFSKFENPLEWEKNQHKFSSLLNGKILPFWTEEILKDIQHKVAAVLMNQVQPQSVETGFK
uniref:Uncharacterized protein n=1 Tax=Marseillevirus LCMAC102 TaxID=2506603 RepID=A0A481YTV8_9VIRU|nr:MAG: uncharacterized protein LCMAC102_03240 [Marseillevirus LCMAC102]